MISSYESSDETFNMLISFINRKNKSSSAEKLLLFFSALKKDYNEVSKHLNTLFEKFGQSALSLFQLLSLLTKIVPDITLKIRLYNFIAAKFEAQGNLDSALKIYSNLRELLPKDLTILEKLAEIYFSLSNLEKALSIFQELYKQNKKSTKYIRKIGEIYMRSDNNDKALDYYINALRIDSSLNSVLEKAYRIIYFQLSEGEIKKSNENARKLTLISFPQALKVKVSELFQTTESQFKICKRIDNILNLGDNDKMLDSIKDIIEYEKENIYAGIYGLKKLMITPLKNKGMVFFLLGECYNNLKDFERAIKFYTSAEKTSYATEAR